MSSEPANPEPGAQLGPFTIGNRLGVGGMGIVFQALDTQLNRQVALKIITPHIGENPEFRARFTREAQAQASLDSPHVVQVYSFGEAEGRLYIASQLIPDGDLGQMLDKHGRPPARIAVNLISQVADGLADAHAAGLIHRDIKPANVLLRNRDSQLQAYLGDFGIARQLGSESHLTQAGGTVGTPSYMAPELHLGGEAGRPSDIYSLGCLLWAALSGKAPYVGSTEYQVVMAHVEQPVPQLAPTGHLAAEINRVLRTAMAKNPLERYSSATALRDDLRRVVRLPDDPTPARPADTPVPEATQPWSFAQARTPTPTPVPLPVASVAQAPPAPPFRTPTPVPHQFAMQPPVGFQHYAGPTTGSHGDGGGGSRRGWIVAAVLVVVLVIGAVVAVVLLAGDDGGPGPGTADDTASTSSGPTESVSGGSDPREAQAVEALTAEFASDPSTDEPTARCFAEQMVQGVGVQGLIEAGVLTEDLEVSDSDGDPEAAMELLGAIGGGILNCLGELGEDGATP